MDFTVIAVSFLFGYFSQKILDTIYEKISSAVKARQLKKKMTQLYVSANTNEFNIIEIATGYPFFTQKNIFLSLNENKYMFLAFPEDLRDKMLPRKNTFHEHDAMTIDIHFDDIPNEILLEQLEKSRRKIAHAFIARESGMFFNGEKYGIYKADSFSRTADEIEIPQLHMEMFKTDYYTHRIILDMLYELKIPLEAINCESLNTTLQWARTSLGVAVIVRLSSGHLLLAVRSKHAAYSDTGKNIVLAASEAFTKTDYDQYDSVPDLFLCVKRALKEELCIKYSMYEAAGIKFLDLFYEYEYYQHCLLALVELNQEITFDEVAKNYPQAKDAKLETEKLFLIPDNQSDIEKFIAKNREQLRDQTIFALKSYCAKKNH